MSLKVKLNCAIGLPIYGFLLMFNGNIGPTELHDEIQDIKIRETLNLTFQGHSK